MSWTLETAANELERYVLRGEPPAVDAVAMMVAWARCGMVGRPRCNDISDFDHESFKCSRCGCRVLSVSGTPDDAKLVAPEGGIVDYGYCPACGAEVAKYRYSRAVHAMVVEEEEDDDK